MQQFKLANNLEIPAIGYGTWKLKNDDETIDIIKEAYTAGYRHFDTAFAYGNEKAIGNAIATMDREKLFLSGKLWNDDRNNVLDAYNRTVKNLQCDYLDLYLLHWPASKAVHENWDIINAKVWEQMEQLYNEKKVRAIGVCNFNVAQLTALETTAKIMPMVNQIEFHIGQTQNELREYCKQKNILVEAWSPLGHGKMLKIPELTTMAEKYNISVAQLCIKWCLDNNVLPIPKSKNPERMRQNLAVHFNISAEDMQTLNSIPYMYGSGLDSETITLFN